jgi:hypothetical protein
MIVPTIRTCALSWNNFQTNILINTHVTSSIVEIIFWLFQLKLMLHSKIILHLKKKS